MKLYRIVDMSLNKKDNGEFKVGSYGTLGGVITDIEECKKTIMYEKEKFMRGERYGAIKITKDTVLEFQGVLVENNGRETKYIIKAMEIEVM